MHQRIKNNFCPSSNDLDESTEKVYDKEGYDSAGYDMWGFNKDEFNKDGYDEDGFNKDGFNKDGKKDKKYNKWGYNIKMT